MMLDAIVDSYLAEHPDETSEHWRIQLHDSVRVLSRHLSAPATVSDLTPDRLNSLLLWLSQCGKSHATRKTRRSALMCVWRYAYESRLTDEPPRCKRVRLPQQTPDAWTVEEVRQLIAAAGAMRGRFRLTRIERAPYMQSLFLSLYSTGLRLGDMLCLTRDAVHPDGHFTIVQSKTRRQVRRYLYPQAVRLLDQTGAADRELCWPLWARREQLFSLIRGIVRDVMPPSRRGTSKWFRRSAGTHYAIEHGEIEASRLLDHRDAATTRGHYLDTSQMPSEPVMGPQYPML